MRSIFFPFFILIFISPVLAAEVRDSVPAGQVESLASDPAWLRLGYYQETLTGYESRVTSSEFFLAPEGREDPLAELQATVAAFQSPQLIRDEQVAQCLYPARYDLLKRKLKNIVEFADQPCDRFEAWRNAIGAHSATLIFPTSYRNNPASMFGHTLLRLDQENQSERTRMLAYAVNYAAETGGEGALLYAAKGVLGGYSGYFTIAPYYTMLRRYSDLENRDIWEYQLAFSSQEVDFLMRHLWELRGVAFRYYYFDENCSYQLLALLEAVRPQINLTKQFYIHVIPIDTVRATLAQEGVLKETHFRPSASTKIHDRMHRMPERLQAVTRSVVERAAPVPEALPEEEKSAVLDLSYDLLEYKRLKEKGDTGNLESQILAILRQRSALPGGGESTDGLQKPVDRSPHRAHKTTRSRLLFRHEYDDRMVDFEIRPAYHDTLDFPEGYTPGFGIDFLDIGLRLREQAGLQLAKVQVLDIESLSPQNAFFSPFSWQFATGLEREYFQPHDDSLQYTTRLAVGKSWGSERMLVAALPEIEIPAASQYDDGLDVRGGVRFTALLARPSVGLKPELRMFTSFLFDSDVQIEARLPLRITLTTNSALRVEAERTWRSDFVYSSLGVSYDFFW